MNLPTNKNQKFQIGDICKLSRVDEFDTLTYPPKTELENWKKDREIMVLHTYSQMFGGGNFSSYSIYFLSTENKNEYSGSFAWVQENQLDFVRKPNESEIELLIQEDKRKQYLPHHKSLLGNDDLEFLNREKIKRNQLNFSASEYWDAGGKLHPQEQMRKLGYKVIGAVPQSMYDSWWFTVEDFIEPLPPYLSKIEYEYERWHR